MKVWVTRDEQPDGPLSSALRKAGMTAILEPVIARRPAPDWDNRHVDTLGESDLLVLTSVYAIELLASLTTHRAMPVAVVGEASKKAAVEAGFNVTFVSSDGTGRTLFAELQKKIGTGRVCYPRSARASVPPPWCGITISCPILYDTTVRDFDRSIIDRAEIIAVASPSAARAIGASNIPFASIGPTTSKALRDLKIEPAVQASQPSFESLADAIASYAGDSRHQRA